MEDAHLHVVLKLDERKEGAHTQSFTQIQIKGHAQIPTVLHERQMAFVKINDKSYYRAYTNRIIDQIHVIRPSLGCKLISSITVDGPYVVLLADVLVEVEVVHTEPKANLCSLITESSLFEAIDLLNSNLEVKQFLAVLVWLVNQSILGYGPTLLLGPDSNTTLVYLDIVKGVFCVESEVEALDL